MPAERLTPAAIAALRCPADQSVKRMTDGLGLYILLHRSGRKAWEFRYRIGAKDNGFTFGDFPALSLADARRLRDRFRGEMAAGKDPRTEWENEKRQTAAAHTRTFAAVALEYQEANPQWRPGYASQVGKILKRAEFVRINSLPIAAITPALMGEVIASATTPKTGRTLLQRAGYVFGYAESKGFIGLGLNPCPPLVGHVAKAGASEPHPAMLEVGSAREMMAAVEKHGPSPVNRLAWRLLALTHLRPGELIGGSFSEFELDYQVEVEDAEGEIARKAVPVWRIPKERMKMNKDHVVPLSRQAVECVQELRALARPKCDLLFESPRIPGQPMSNDGAFSTALEASGYRPVQHPHGLRSTFSTIMNKRRRRDTDLIELMLAHVRKGVAARYNREEFLVERHALTQEYADLLCRDLPPAKALVEMRPAPAALEIAHAMAAE